MKIQYDIRSGVVVAGLRTGTALSCLQMILPDRLKNGAYLIAQRALCLSVELNENLFIDGDLLVLENATFDDEILKFLGLISPGVTVLEIREGAVSNEVQVYVPSELRGFLHCANPRCISHTEPYLESRFTIVDADSPTLACVYCEREFLRGELPGFV